MVKASDVGAGRFVKYICGHQRMVPAGWRDHEAPPCEVCRIQRLVDALRLLIDAADDNARFNAEERAQELINAEAQHGF